jgi:hypothetical protein
MARQQLCKGPHDADLIRHTRAAACHDDSGLLLQWHVVLVHPQLSPRLIFPDASLVTLS